MLSRIPPVVRALLIANAVAFLLQLIVPEERVVPFELWPWHSPSAADLPGSTFLPWQLVTSAFLHADPFHLLFNMMGLVMCGMSLEYRWGGRGFLAYYAVSVVGASLCQLALASWSVAQGGEAYATLGASGGVYGLILAYGLLFPTHRVMLLFPPIPMSARTFAIVLGAMALLFGLTGQEAGVAHFAHLGGMLAGGLMLLLWRGRRPPGTAPPPPKRKRPSHLRVVK
jgi:membrane associated rhomboid family serine protease